MDNAATTDPNILMWVAIVGAIIFVACLITYVLLAKFPELEKKLAKLTWGDDADLEVYNRSGRWL